MSALPRPRVTSTAFEAAKRFELANIILQDLCFIFILYLRFDQTQDT